MGLFARVRSGGLDTGLVVSPSAPAGPNSLAAGLAHPRCVAVEHFVSKMNHTPAQGVSYGVGAAGRVELVEKLADMEFSGVHREA